MGGSFINKFIARQTGRSEESLPVSSEPQPEQSSNASGDWLEENDEGQLSVDVFQTADSVIIKSTIAGVRPEDIDISINNDMITIRGQRQNEEDVAEDDYFYQECYWGAFSRSIILPVEVKAEEVDATLKNGVLTVSLPKAKKSKSVSVKVSTD